MAISTNASVNNFFRQTITDMVANGNTPITELNLEFRRNNNDFPCNFLFFKNNANNKVTVELNGDSRERYEIEGNGGTFIINQEDFIDYQSINLVEENGNAITGKMIVTGGVVRPKKRIIDEV